jgi:two-component system response regulator FixJ
MEPAMESARTRVYVVDDDPLLRKAIVRLLEQAERQAVTFDSAKAFLLAYPSLQTGCILMDLTMPGMNGFELQQRLIEKGCRWPVIVLTGHSDNANVVRAMAAGAMAFLEKPVRQAELYAAILKAEAYLAGSTDAFPDPELARRVSQLTRRETDVLSGVMEKKGNKEIAAELGIRETSVKGYRRKAMKKIGAKNTAELVMLTLRAGFKVRPRS